MIDWLFFVAWILLVIVVFGVVVPSIHSAVSDPRSDHVLGVFTSWALGLAVVVGLVVWRFAS